MFPISREENDWLLKHGGDQDALYKIFEMETSSSRSLVDEDRVLKGLLEVFGSTFSLRAIASAFVKAGHNAELAAEFLSDSQETTSDEPITHASNTETSVASSSEQLSESIVDESTHAGRNYKASKPKKNSVSMGTVSCVLGKGYPRSITSATEISEAYKPLKVDVTGLPMDELFKEDASSNSTVRSDNMHKDTEDFLFKMLGKGFQLDMNLIREVLGCCGYDAKKSMEKLMDMSAPTLKKSDDIISGSTRKFADKYPEPKSPISQEKSQYNGFAKSPLPSQDKERYDLPREVLASLFTVPERFEEIPRRGRPIRAIKKKRSVGKVVFEPPRDTSPVHSTAIVESQHDTEDEKEEENYQVLRRAAKEHWNTMKEYYKAAVEAFVNGDLIKADKLQEEGQYFNNKAREADDKSAQATLQRRKKESQDDLTIDLHDHDKKEAISMLKLQLTNLSGIPSFQYLKVILETDAEDTSKGSRKRLVLKLLERESIKWTEDEKNPGAILIKLDEINPKNLSFGKKAL